MKIETTNDIMKATREELIDYALDVTSERNELKRQVDIMFYENEQCAIAAGLTIDCSHPLGIVRKLVKENAELKARLEKTVELPVKVGDTIYRICPKCNDRMQIAIDEGKRACHECAWDACMWGASGEGCTVFGLRDDGNYSADKCLIVPEKVRWGNIPKIERELNKKIFLTREAAEARLKELEEQK